MEDEKRWRMRKDGGNVADYTSKNLDYTSSDKQEVIEEQWKLGPTKLPTRTLNLNGFWRLLLVERIVSSSEHGSRIQKQPGVEVEAASILHTDDKGDVPSQAGRQ
ncbi:hypothetical protein E8E11_002760 [Didymella keratinophila]|nr:hypothetical protein E8E11_002760 [Didymella keratinophila]